MERQTDVTNVLARVILTAFKVAAGKKVKMFYVFVSRDDAPPDNLK